MTTPTRRILVTGSTGQIGSELTPALRQRYGGDAVVALGHKTAPTDELRNAGPFDVADATDREALGGIVEKHRIDTVYHLASILSARGEQDPHAAWRVNMMSLKNVLDLAVEQCMAQVFWPSSIAVFGPTTPREQTPQRTITEPSTMYGITKVAGELLCEYYFSKYGLDVRSLRYPGLISYRTLPGGGTTDYAVEIFHAAVKTDRYRCFVREDTVLPMMYMDDAMRAAVELMAAPAAAITVRTSYNLAAVSFSAGDLAAAVAEHRSEFQCQYEPDERQQTADSWPNSVDDTAARRDWGWQPHFGLRRIVADMLEHVA